MIFPGTPPGNSAAQDVLTASDKEDFGPCISITSSRPNRGAEVVKSREIASQKMFLIHNTLGEDVKIFAPEETPSPADLFRRINRNPEEEEEESLLTSIRKEYYAIKEEHPELVSRLSDFPARVKTAKFQSRMSCWFSAGRAFSFYSCSTGYSRGSQRYSPLFEEALPRIRCHPETQRQPLSDRFWPAYETIKAYREQTPMPRSEQSLFVRAENNLRSAMINHAAELEEYLPFIQTLLRDLKEFQTLPKYTMRRLTMIEMDGKVSKKGLERFCAQLEALRRYLGSDYLERIEQRTKDFRSEIIMLWKHKNYIRGVPCHPGNKPNHFVMPSVCSVHPFPSTCSRPMPQPSM